MQLSGFVILGAAAVVVGACSDGTLVPVPGTSTSDGSADFDASQVHDGASDTSSSSIESSSGDASDAQTTSDESSLTDADGRDGASDAGAVNADATCTVADICPAPNGGVAFNCEKRFVFGVNYAWQNWGYDFGGGSQGVAGNSPTIKAALQDMQSHGADVIRWWMFQELNGNNGVALDLSGVPTGGAGGTLVADIRAALLLASQVGVHYNLTLFSFDNFVFSSGRYDLAPIIATDANRAKLMQFVGLVAHTVESDPNRDRVVSWDVINEPEWAIGAKAGDVDASVVGGTDPYGDQTFAAGASGKVYDLVTFSEMETFVRDTVIALHQNSSALVTVGSAAVKWKQAWQHVGLDYYTVHMYDWINQYYPYTNSVASYGFSLPVILGEFPNQGLTGVAYATLLGTIFGSGVGYAGAMSWSYTDQSFPWTGPNGGASNMQAFAATKPCVAKY